MANVKKSLFEIRTFVKIYNIPISYLDLQHSLLNLFFVSLAKVLQLNTVVKKKLIKIISQ